jgi:uncharacterized protein (DUF433 family)
MKKHVRGRIFIDPEVHFGKPCIAGTRTTVESVLELLQEGLSFQEIQRDYFPDLTVDDISACVRYAVEVVRTEEVITEVA